MGENRVAYRPACCSTHPIPAPGADPSRKDARGTGGAGLGAAGVAGTAGGAFTVAGQFPPHLGGAGGSAATTPPQNGTGGYEPIPRLFYGYGGTGGGSTHGTATGAGLVQASGGNGAVGCGGGGMGGALTASAAGQVGQGGVAWCCIVCW